jgi:hypothetical protein
MMLSGFNASKPFLGGTAILRRSRRRRLCRYYGFDATFRFQPRQLSLRSGAKTALEKNETDVSKASSRRDINNVQDALFFSMQPMADGRNAPRWRYH